MSVSLGSVIFKSSNDRGDQLDFDLSANFNNPIDSISNLTVNGVVIDASAVASIVTIGGNFSVNIDLEALLDYLREQDQQFWSSDSIQDSSPILEISFDVADANGNTETTGLQLINNAGGGFLADDYAPTVEVGDNATIAVLSGEGANDLTISEITGVFFDDNPSGAGANGTQWISLSSQDIATYVTIGANGTITIDTSFLANYDLATGWNHFPEVKVEYTVSDGNGGEYTAEAFVSVLQPDADSQTNSTSHFANTDNFYVDLLDTNWEDVLPNSNQIDSPEEFRTVKPINLHLFANNNDSIDINGNQSGHNSIISIDSVNQNNSTPNFNIQASDLANLVEIVDADAGIIRFNSDYLYENYLQFEGEFINIFSVNIEYTVNNNGVSEQANAFVTFSATNRAPTATNNFTNNDDLVDVGEVAVLDVLADDWDVDGDRIRISDITDAVIVEQNGRSETVIETLTQSQLDQAATVVDGKIHFDTSLLDSFGITIEPGQFIRIGYEIADNFGATDTSTGTINFVQAVDLTPTARNDFYMSRTDIDDAENGELCFDVIQNDIPGDGPITLVEGGFKNLIIDNNIFIDDSEINNYLRIEDGQVKFDITTLDVERNDIVVVKFDYTIQDIDGDTSMATVTFNVSNPNEEPQIIEAEFVEDEDSLVNSGARRGNVVDQDDSIGQQVTDQDAVSNDGLFGELIFSYANATDADGDTLTYSIDTNRHDIMTGTDSNGDTYEFITVKGYEIKLIDDNRLEFNPEDFQELNEGDLENFNIYYTVSDGFDTVDGSVNIKILGTDDKATITNAEFVDDEDAHFDAIAGDLDDATGNVVGGPNDPDGQLSFNISERIEDVDNNFNSFTRIPNATQTLDIIGEDGNPTGETINVSYTLASNGVLTITNQPALDALKEGEYVTLPVDFVVNDTNLSANFTILGTNDAPIAVNDPNSINPNNDAATVDEGECINIDILANDYDPEGDDISFIENSFANLVINGQAIDPSEISTYVTWENGQAKFDASTIVIPDGTGDQVATFTYTIEDEDGLTDTATVTVIIKDIIDNTPPEANDSWFIEDEDDVANSGASGVYTGSTDEYNGVTINNGDTITDQDDSAATGEQNGRMRFVLDAGDADAGDQLTFSGIPSIITGSNGAQYTVIDNFDGSFSLIETQFNGLGRDETVTFDFDYTVSDGTDSNTANAKVTIIGSNDKPDACECVFVEDEDGIENSGAAANGFTDLDDSEESLNTSDVMVFEIKSNDVDGDTLTYSGIPDSVTVGNKTFTIINNGDGTFAINKSEFQYLAKGESVTFTFDYTVSDGLLDDSATVTTTIIGTNDGLIDGDEAVDISYGDDASVNVLLNSDDIDDSDVVTVDSYGTPVVVGPNGPIDNPPAGLITLNPDGTIDIDSDQLPPLGTGQQYTITIPYTVTDGNGEFDNSTAVITINSDNMPPEINPEGIVDDEDAILDAPVAANQVDENDSLVDGTNEQDANILRFDLKDVVTDIDGDTVEVTNVATSSVQVTMPNGNVETVQISHDGNGIINIDNPEVLDQLNVGDVIEIPVEFTVTDNINPAVTGTTNIKILGTDDKAEIEADPFVDDEDAVTNAINGDLDDALDNSNDPQIDGTLEFDIASKVSDVDNADKVFTPINNGSATVDILNSNGSATGETILVTFTLSSTGIFTVTNQPNLDQLGEGEYINIPLDFNVNNTDLDTVVRILGTNDGPIATDDTDSGEYGDLIELNVITNTVPNGMDSDPDGDVLTVTNYTNFELNGQPYDQTSGAFLLGTNGYVGLDSSQLPPLAQGESHVITFDYEITDGNGGFDTATVTITINGNNQPPQIDMGPFVDDEDAILDAPVAANQVDENDSLVDGTNEQDANILRFDLQDAVIDPDGPTPHTFSNISTSANAMSSNGKSITVNFDINGSVIEISNPEVLDQLSLGETIDFNVTFTVSDNVNPAVTGTTKIRILGTDDKAEIEAGPFVDDEDAVTNAVSGDLDDALNNSNDPAIDGDLIFNIASKVTDIDNSTLDFTDINNGTATVDILDSNGVTTGDTITVNYNMIDGVLTITNQPDLDVLELGEYINIPVDFVVNNTNLSTAIRILGTDDGPRTMDIEFIEDEDAIEGTNAAAGGLVDEDDSEANLNTDTVMVFDLTQAVTFAGVGALTYGIPNIATGDDGNAYTLIDNGDGTFGLNKADYQALSIGEKVELTFNFTVTDGNGDSSTSTAVVNIIGTNDAPDAVDDIRVIEPNDVITIPVLNNDSDPEGDTLDVISIDDFTFNGNPISNDNGEIVINNDNTITVDSDGLNLPKGRVSEVKFTYTISDGNGGTDTATVTVYIPGPNEFISAMSPDATTTAMDNIKVTSVAVVGQNISYGADIITLSEFDDTITTDVTDFTIEAEAGDATAIARPESQGGNESATAITDVTIANNIYTAGDDIVKAGAGDDKITGDFQDLNFIGKQGDATATVDDECLDGNAYASANVSIRNNTFEMGDDVIAGDAGNDTLIGDVETMSIEYTDGVSMEMDNNSGNATVNDNDDWLTDNNFNFGNDRLEGGEGNDTITGDMRFVEIDGVTYDLSQASDFTLFQQTDYYQMNAFNFGADTFVFQLDSDFGSDIITDFGRGDDVLEINGLGDVTGDGVANLTDLVARSSVENDGNGSIRLLIDSNNDGNIEGTITIANIEFVNGQLEIDDYLNDTQVNIIL